MKYLLAVVAVLALLTLATPHVLAQANDSRPRNIPAESWIQIGPDTGFVVTREATRGPAGPVVGGYLMARRKGQWVRLESEHVGAFVPAG